MTRHRRADGQDPSDLPTVPYDRAQGASRPGEAPMPEIPGLVVERLLGEGGMGRVYLAHQTAPVARRVAVKMLRAHLDDSESARRFASEQRALGRLNHPAIAQLYDAGATGDGRPYVVMEYVDGLPLTEYCDRERLPVEERLALFAAVCRGVEHAHRRQLLHRDLKPSNVLVTVADGRPVPKIIDFGIARTLDGAQGGATVTGARVLGTPQYMSPEALEPTDGPRDLDTRADVYSLGVVLYELLTGCRPFDAPSGELVTLIRRISEEDPARPSTRVRRHDDATRDEVARARAGEGRTLVRRLGGDLDWITLKALARDREDRYGSPAALADDLDRSLRHEPITARPPSLPDRLGRLARRHRVAAGVAAVALMAVLAAAVLSSLALVRAIRAEHQAQAEATATQEVVAFLVDLFEAARPEEDLGRDLSARDLVARGADRIAAQDLPPLQRARLLHTLADAQMRLGEYSAGIELASEALKIRDDLLEDGHPDLFATLDLLGTLERRAGHFGAAERHLERLVGLAEARPDDRGDLADALNSLANLRWRQERMEEAEALHTRALALRRGLFADDPAVGIEVAASLNNLGVLLWAQDRPAEAEPYLRQAASLYEQELGPEHPRVADALGNLGTVLLALDRPEEAETLQRRTLALREKVLGPDHPDTSAALNNLAVIFARTGREEEAEAAYRRTLEIRRRALGEDHPETAKTRRNLARLLEREGRSAEAEALQVAATPPGS